MFENHWTTDVRAQNTLKIVSRPLVPASDLPLAAPRRAGHAKAPRRFFDISRLLAPVRALAPMPAPQAA